MQGKVFQDFIVGKIDDLKAKNIITIDVKGKSSITDCMVICTGVSGRHVLSIAGRLVETVRAAGLDAMSVKGFRETDWIVVDLGEVIVHVMQEESRQLYALEELWG